MTDEPRRRNPYNGPERRSSGIAEITELRGSVIIPEALRPYMGGLEKISGV